MRCFINGVRSLACVAVALAALIGAAAPTLAQVGKCCIPDQGCQNLTESECDSLGGTFVADQVCASPDDVCLTGLQGACCANGQCAITLPTRCNVRGAVFMLGVPCAPSPCGAPPTGACCAGTSCSIATLSDCAGAWQGPDTVCGDADNPTTCCPANFNGIGGVTVQDIFDFLGAYFTSDPLADFNQSGDVSVQDIFDFLQAYFAGC